MKALILIAAFFGSAAMATPCIDGAKAWFNEPTANGDHYVQVQRTCVNGSYYDLSNYVYNPKTKCQEGRQSWFSEPTGNGDHYKQVLRTCVNGSYYDLSNYVYNPKTKCQEGRVQTTTEYDYSVNDHGRLVTQVCVNGKWKTRP